MSPLWTGSDMAQAMGGRPLGALPAAITGISIDSRSIGPGEAFFAIKGDRFDGHDFATAATAAGAALLVVAEAKIPALGRIVTPMIVVDDVLKGLERLGAAARARTSAQVIAVTGSAGKTSTKETLRRILSPSGAVHAADNSFNNHWGVPLTLARMPRETAFAVIEIGMNHADEVRPLVKLARPHVAIVTLIAAAHLGHFHSLDDIARAKGEIFEGVVPDGHAVINRDDHRWRILEKLAKEAGVKHIHGFGEHSRAQFKLLSCSLAADHSDISAKIAGKPVSARIGAPGRHIVQNVVAALGAASLAGADLDKAAAALAGLSAEKGRGQRHVLAKGAGAFTLIDESYNANPASMRAAIELLDAAEPTGQGRRIAVLGDMLELGQHSNKLHAALVEPVTESNIDIVMTAGEAMRALQDVLPSGLAGRHFASVAELSESLATEIRAGDVVMVKSSKSIGFGKIVDALVERFGRKHAAA